MLERSEKMKKAFEVFSEKLERFELEMLYKKLSENRSFVKHLIKYKEIETIKLAPKKVFLAYLFSLVMKGLEK